MKEIDEIKQIFAQQVKSEFENPRISPFTKDWQKGVDLLFESIKFADFYHKLLDILTDVLIEKTTDFNALVSFATYLERYLAFVANLIGKPPEDNKLTLMPLLRGLELHKKYPSFDWKKVDKLRDEPEFMAHFCRASCTRNDIAHSKKQGKLPLWNQDQLAIMQNRNSIIIVFLYLILFYYKEIEQKLEERKFSEEPDINPYLNAVIYRFKKWKQRFIAMHGIEKIELYAREELEDENRKAREGTIESLREKIPERQMMILGEAGMGKTTTLQYLAFEDSKKCLQNQTVENIPVYLALRIISAGHSIYEEVLRELPFSSKFTETLLQNGKINLFLDGLNEVNKYEKQRVVNECQNLINRYPCVTVLIASRNSHRFITNENQRVPVFAFKRMKQIQLTEFLEKNANETSRQIIQKAMAISENILDWLRIPMWLKMMIEVVEERIRQGLLDEDWIPENKNELLADFLKKLYLRENERDVNFSETTFDALASHLARKIFEKTESNIGLPRHKVLNILEEKVKSGFPNADLDYFLKVGTELSIFALNNNDMYSFSHDEFFDYYAAKGIQSHGGDIFKNLF